MGEGGGLAASAQAENLELLNAAFWKTAIASKATGEDAKAFYELARARKLTE